MRMARKDPRPPLDKRIISFKNGLAELPECIAAALGHAVKTGVSLTAVEPSQAGWTIHWQGQAHPYDEVILTLPAHAVANLPLPPDLLAALGFLSRIDYPPVSVLSLAFRRSEVAHPLDGFGMLVPEAEKRRILGVLFPSTLFEGRAPEGEVMLTVFIGGERQPELAVADTTSVLATALPELRDLLGVSGEPRFVHHKHWPRAIPQYKLGYGQWLRQMEQVEQQFPGLKLAGNYRYGISLSYCIEAASGT
jgi:oxygen-dependent protoporphyrinogen oxidase